MCRRIEIAKKNQIDYLVYQDHKVTFNAIENKELRPTQELACLHYFRGQLSQLNAHWGIQPDWAEHKIINANQETVATKKTFSSAWALA